MDSLDDVQAQYEKVKGALSNRDVEVDYLEAEIKKQLQLAATCAQAAVSAIGKLLDEQAAGTGTSGTIEKMESLRDECAAATAS